MAGEKTERLTATDGRSAASVRGRSGLAEICECLVKLMLSVSVASVEMSGGVRPFGIGMVTAAGTGASGIFSLAGAIAGSFITHDVFTALRYVCAVSLAFVIVFVMRRTELSSKSWLSPTAACVVSASIGFVYAADSGWTVTAVSAFVMEVILAGASSVFFGIALSSWGGDGDAEGSRRYAVSALFLLSAVLAGVSGIKIFGFISVARAVSAAAVMLTAYRCGSGKGCAAGVMFGLFMDMTGGRQMLYTAAYGFAALVSGAVPKKRKLWFVFAYILANAAAVLWLMPKMADYAVLYEVFIASVVFMLLPETIMARLTSLGTSTVSGYGALKARDYMRDRIAMTAGVFRELCETVRTSVGEGRNDEDIAGVFDRAAEAVCCDCPSCRECWVKDYSNTVDAMNGVTFNMRKRGRLEHDDFPDWFRSKCCRLADYSAAVNDELRALIYRRQYRARLKEKQSAVCAQYSGIAAVLQGISDELGGSVDAEPVLERKLQKYLRAINAEGSAAVFRDRGGRLHAEIASPNLALMYRDKNWLMKLSQVLETRLCAAADAGARGRLSLLEAEPLAAAVGIAARKKDGQEVSGDRGTFFRTDDGVLYILLSDGMGTGEGAAKASGGAVYMLEKFLRAGVMPETALRILSDLMLLKNDGDLMSATVDLMCIDLFSGVARIFKYGAAPTYVRKGNAIRRVRSGGVSVGLGAVSSESPECTKVKIEPGMCALIMSDGVASDREDGWLREAFSDYGGNDARELARLILERAGEVNGYCDDMTVLAVMLEERK